MVSKKERNYYKMKESKNYCRTKTFPKRGWKRGKENFLQINSAWYNLKIHVRYFFKKMCTSLDIGKVKKYLVTACMHLFRSRVQLYSSILDFH